MKRVVGFFLGILLLFSFVKNASADCKNKGLLGCGSGYNQCNNPTTCCSSLSECAQYNTTGCTQVGSNQTSCESSQPVACNQQMPNAGNIRRFCCDTQAACDAKKENIQQEITSKLAKPGDSNDVFCPGDKTEINTAIGCIHVLGGTESFLGDVLKWAVGVGGGIAFLLIVYASFLIMSSAGNPERLKAGQELLTSAISGLILLVLSIFVLKFIGIDILGLNQFGFGGQSTTQTGGGGSTFKK